MTEEAKQKIAELLSKYESLSPSQIKGFHEAKTKQGFIEPLFRALGWDFDDTNEVAPEEQASSGRVDYAFKINSVSQFYLEAKPLRADLTRPEYVKQAITYAYNKGVTWAILTDFAELRIYNAQTQTGHPFINLTYDRYLPSFDDLWLLSKESFQTNALSEKAQKYGALPPRLGIEQRLFKQLRQWRGELFTQLHHYNPNLSFNQIDEVIQRLFNRLVFIRTCEDRGIENRVLLSALHEWNQAKQKGELIQDVRNVFSDFDGFYDSDLFEHHLIDDEQVFVESATIEDILNGLYEVPGGMASYDFSLIDADVLGAVYEQYLGYVATVVKQRAKEAQAQMDLGIPGVETFEITAKKQRRKEHGIYYTPKFVTDHIVKETVGRFLKERNYNEIRNIKILDPACGSGSFLIRAYDELLNYHAYQRGKPVSELDQWERLPILTNNIFGVDLDMQAVDIARLNLLLRSLARRQKLPYLDDNIREGNSLISGNEKELKKYFGDSWREKKPFNWEQEFEDIMAKGGFDVVIGNPPYIQVSMDTKLAPELKEYLITKFGSSMGRLNTFGFFVHRGISLLKQGGLLGFIVPNTFLTQEYYRQLRKFVLDTCQVLTIATLEEMPFEAAVVENVVVTLRKESSESVRQKNEVRVMALGKDNEYLIPQSIFNDTFNYSFVVHLSTKLRTLKEKIDAHTDKLGELLNINQAIALKYDRSSSLSKEQRDNNYKKVLDGRDILRYAIYFPGNYLLYDVSRIHSCKREDIFLAKEKLFFRRVGDGIVATLDTDQYYALNTLVVATPKVQDINLKFVLGLVNSALSNSYYRLFLKSTKKVFSEIQARQMEQLPIRRIDFDNPTEKKRHDDLVALVDRMLELNKQLAPIRNTYCHERDELVKQIEQTDKEIDKLVYDLYGLAEEERKIVEGGT
ncbi:Eco57I restriction-modification methylase domain-containing protein [Chloroflexota bacterium]